MEEFHIYFCGGFSYCERRRTRGKNCCRVKGFAVGFLSEGPGTRRCYESMISATEASSRYSIADESRNSLAKTGEGPVQRLGAGRGCDKFVPVLGGNGPKIGPTGDIFDQPLGQMR